METIAAGVATAEELVDMSKAIDFKSIDSGALPERFAYRFVKRSFDIVFSLLVVAVGFVPALILAIVVAFDTKGSPIYTQERMGRGGKPFKMCKFRTMVADADNVEKHLSEEQLKTWLCERKVDDDPRVTRLGKFLRSTSIDEFPQFVNVLFGQMSIIGSRAVTAEELEFFGSCKDLVLSLRPGITGLWQTGPRNEATFVSGLRQRIEIMYALNACLSLDAELFFRTFKVIVERTGR